MSNDELREALQKLREDHETLKRQVADYQATASSLAGHDRNWGATKTSLDKAHNDGHVRDDRLQAFQQRIAELESWRGTTDTVINLLRASVETAFKAAEIPFRFIGGS